MYTLAGPTLIILFLNRLSVKKNCDSYVVFRRLLFLLPFLILGLANRYYFTSLRAFFVGL